jgi:hypothetical protein
LPIDAALERLVTFSLDKFDPTVVLALLKSLKSPRSQEFCASIDERMRVARVMK